MCRIGVVVTRGFSRNITIYLQRACVAGGTERSEDVGHGGVVSRPLAHLHVRPSLSNRTHGFTLGSDCCNIWLTILPSLIRQTSGDPWNGRSEVAVAIKVDVVDIRSKVDEIWHDTSQHV